MGNYYKGKLNPKFKTWAEAGESLNDPPGVYTRPENRAMFNTIVRQLARTANRRLTMLENSKMTDAPSYLKAGGRGVRWNTDPANLSPQAIVREFGQLRRFLDNKTSTPAGFKNVNEHLNRRLEYELDRENRATLWQNYNKLKEMHPSWESIGLTSNEVQKMIVEIRFKNKIVDDIASFEKRIQEISREEGYRWFTTQ